MSLALWRGGVGGGLLGEVLERHETVVGFFGQTQHMDSLSSFAARIELKRLIRPYWS